MRRSRYSNRHNKDVLPVQEVWEVPQQIDQLLLKHRELQEVVPQRQAAKPLSPLPLNQTWQELEDFSSSLFNNNKCSSNSKWGRECSSSKEEVGAILTIPSFHCTMVLGMVQEVMEWVAFAGAGANSLDSKEAVKRKVGAARLSA